MDTKKIIKTYDKVFQPLKDVWQDSKNGQEYNQVLDTFLDELSLEKNSKTRYIAYQRIVNLNPEPLKTYLKTSLEKAKENIKSLKVDIPNKLENTQYLLNKAYYYVEKVYNFYFEKFIEELKNENIDQFTITLLEWSFFVWKAFNKFSVSWLNHIEKQNEILDKLFDNNSEKIMAYLKEKNLLEKDENGNLTDRSYTVLKWGKMLSYAEAFPADIQNIARAIDEFISNLTDLTDSPDLTDWNNENKNLIIKYLEAIKKAYLETDTTKLLKRWQEVDRVWMDIKIPLQIVHPMEFYDDKYRKAVAPEFDIRVKDEETLKSNVQTNILQMFEMFMENFWKEKYAQAYKFSKNAIDKVQLYISQPVIFSWTYLNWHFSAQIVPNDEQITKEKWKKIFAFPKKVLEEKRKTPKTKHTQLTIDEELYEDYKNILENEKLFYTIYDVETIGHEYGHALWLAEDTEVLMNLKTWNFKNIEEWKATSWWLMSYFLTTQATDFSKNTFEYNMLLMHILRSVKLLVYKDIVEILPYYNEALIHLDILYNSGILSIDNTKVKINFNEENYKKLVKLYTQAYEKLIKTYLDKKDAGEFLFDYVQTEKDGTNLPKNEKLKDFAIKYYDLYQKYGNETVD